MSDSTAASQMGRHVEATDSKPRGRAAPRTEDTSRFLVRSVWLLVGVALASRLVFALALFPGIQAWTGLSPGSDGYELIAETLAAGGGYRFAPHLGQTMFVPPVYPLFLAALFKLTDHHLLITQVAQSILDTVSCLLVFSIGRRSLGFAAALVGASLYALYPGTWVACSRYLSEPLFVFLTLVFVDCFSRFLMNRDWRWAVVGTFCCGVSVLCKSVAGALPFFLLMSAVFIPAWRGRRVRAVGGLSLGVLLTGLVVGPWIYRNYRLTGEFVYPSTSGGLAVYTAHVYAAHPEQSIRKSVHQAAAEVGQLAEDHGIRLDPGDTYPRWFYDPHDEVRLDHLAQEAAMEGIAADRAGFVHHIAGNFWRFWAGAPTRKSVVISILLNLPLVALGAVGLVASRWWRDATLSLWVATSVYLFLAHVTILAVVRYSLTVMPLVCLLSGVVLCRVYLWRRARGGGSRGATQRGGAGVSRGTLTPP